MASQGARTYETNALDRVAHLLKLSSKATARAMQDRLAEHSVAYGHWTFLRILWSANGITVTELSRLANVAKPATVSAVRSMEALGYVERLQKVGNQKSIYISLTAHGRRLESVLVPLALEVNDIALKSFSPERRDLLKQMLLEIIHNLEDAERPRTGPDRPEE